MRFNLILLIPCGYDSSLVGPSYIIFKVQLFIIIIKHLAYFGLALQLHIQVSALVEFVYKLHQVEHLLLIIACVHRVALKHDLAQCQPYPTCEPLPIGRC